MLKQAGSKTSGTKSFAFGSDVEDKSYHYGSEASKNTLFRGLVSDLASSSSKFCAPSAKYTYFVSWILRKHAYDNDLALGKSTDYL